MAVIMGLGRYIIMAFIKAEEAGVIDAAYKYVFIDVSFTGVIALLFIFRYSIQGIGKSLTAMAAGFMEMTARLVMSLFVIPFVGWTAACFTDPMAWAAGMIYCAVTFVILLRIKERQHGKN